MAKTIAQGFQILCGNTNISGLQEETASTRQKNVREAVEKELDVLDSFLTGSYRRNTMLAPLSGADIDVFVVLDPKYYQSDGQAALLDKVKATLKKTYPKTPKISRNGQAVTITFTDFKVDVVQASTVKAGDISSRIRRVANGLRLTQRSTWTSGRRRTRRTMAISCRCSRSSRRGTNLTMT